MLGPQVSKEKNKPLMECEEVKLNNNNNKGDKNMPRDSVRSLTSPS